MRRIFVAAEYVWVAALGDVPMDYDAVEEEDSFEEGIESEEQDNDSGSD